MKVIYTLSFSGILNASTMFLPDVGVLLRLAFSCTLRAPLIRVTIYSVSMVDACNNVLGAPTIHVFDPRDKVNTASGACVAAMPSTVSASPSSRASKGNVSCTASMNVSVQIAVCTNDDAVVSQGGTAAAAATALASQLSSPCPSSGCLPLDGFIAALDAGAAQSTSSPATVTGGVSVVTGSSSGSTNSGPPSMSTAVVGAAISGACLAVLFAAGIVYAIRRRRALHTPLAGVASSPPDNALFNNGPVNQQNRVADMFYDNPFKDLHTLRALKKPAV